MGIDLDNFPTSPAARRMMSRITPIYGRSYTGKWIFESMGTEIDFAEQKFAELKQQASPETATWGLKYWEQRYGIFPDELDSLEERRRKIISRRITRAPMNPVNMGRILSAFCGRETGIKENVAPYTFMVTVSENGCAGVDIAGLLSLIHEIKPAHQTCSVRFVSNTNIYAGAGQCMVYRPAAIIDGYSVSREAGHSVYAGAEQNMVYEPAAVTDGFSVSRKTGQAVCTGAAVGQVSCQTVKI